MGFLSSAYSAQVSPTVAISSRFGVNVYSYESDLSVGGEWWIGRRRGKREVPTTPSLEEQRKLESKRAALQEASLREDRFDTVTEVESLSSKMSNQSTMVNDTVPTPEERDGVLKARISGDWVSFSHSRTVPKSKLMNQSIALLYEARIRKCLVSVGVISDLLSRQRPIQSIGLEVQYFS
jgi:distribution and morphology protein 10